jgi:phosphoesterase RecJ-like protein
MKNLSAQVDNPMDWSTSLVQEIRQELSAVQRVLIVSHIRPDGDAIGSLIGLGLALHEAGKEVQMVISDGLPASFRFLAGSELVSKKARGQFDYRIVVDASELARLGNALDEQSEIDLNIDHHITNTCFGRHNLVVKDAAATCEILARLIPSLGLSITNRVANALLTGMVTDTIGFRTSNVTPDFLRLAAQLMEHGADLAQVYYAGLVQHTYPALLYWGAGLGRLNYQDGLVWTLLSLADRDIAGYSGRDDADLINVLSSVEGAVIALIFVEQSSGRVKISWRVCGPSQIDADVSVIAQQFGGGGHKAAAGAEIAGSLESVKEKVLEATRVYLSDLQQEHRSLDG